MAKIEKVLAREVMDSRGNPTVEVEVWVEGGAVGRAIVPSGASTGSYEAVELRDGGKRCGGKGVREAVRNVNKIIGPQLVGRDVEAQKEIDAFMLEMDGTQNKSNLGANAILGVSIACVKAAAAAAKKPLYAYLGGDDATLLPVPLVNVLNGGKHADNNLDFQEFMLVPLGFERFADAIWATTEVFAQLRDVLRRRGLLCGVGDEGGYAPQLRSNAEALELLMDAVNNAGYEPGRHFLLALDVAASELHRNGKYVLRAETDGEKSTEDMIEMFVELVDEFPIFSIEDGLAEGDWEGWTTLTRRLGHLVQLVGDDLFVTNIQWIQKGIEMGAANAVLIKPNQIGTVTETKEAVDLAKQHNFATIISHRSGDTEDTTIADLAVGWGLGQIKTGSVCRGERTAKYNRLLRIEEELGERARYAGAFIRQSR